MAKKPERKRKLKVFRTPIGFHDAYVAAPNRKAALEAWGADSNIFAQGIAEEVSDPALMEEPLASPGKVIRRVRGSTDEHFAELERSAPKPNKAARRAEEEGGKVVELKPKSKPRPKPSRKELDSADEALEKAEKRQRRKLSEIDEKMRELERKRRELQRRHEEERDTLARKRDKARSAYDRALREWKR
jgi:flagellar motility protein MotE (MotC chaperone)